jgi:hypothetical protein
MFYSQDIVAKQGPLGTIWIAAHSANAAKLRKTQIADTDLPGSCGAPSLPVSPLVHAYACLWAAR